MKGIICSVFVMLATVLSLGPVASRAGADATLSNPTASANAPRYAIVDLGSLGDGSSQSFAINARGQIVGRAYTVDGNQHAVFWRESKGSPVELATLGAFFANANAISDSGLIVGVSAASELSPPHAVLWSNSTSSAIDLGSFGGWSEAHGVNAGGQIVGFAEAGGGYPHAAFWADSNSLVVDLDPLGLASEAHAINASGQIVGNAFRNDTVHAAFWPDSSSLATDLGSLGGVDSGGSDALAINAAGQIVGWSGTDFGGQHAVFWANSSSPPTDLGILAGGYSSFAQAINASGQIVGFASCTCTFGRHAVIWLDSNSSAVDLNSLVSAESGWELLYAYGINNSGAIVGYGIHNDGLAHAFVLIPARSNN